MSEKYQDLLIKKLQNIEVSNVEVIFESPIVFLCGGNADVKNNPPKSIRHRFIDHCLKDKSLSDSFILAEAFTDYLSQDAYSDLLTFEDDIANISSLVIIFLESAGSIIEFGVFCVRDTIKKKLIVFAQEEKTRDRSSFIYLGPVTYLRSYNEDSVRIYPWSNDSEIKKTDLNAIYMDVKESLDKAHKTEKFNVSNSGHIAFLIYEIISVAKPIKLGEILSVLKIILGEITEAKVRRLIYLLNSVGLIGIIEYSSSEFYYNLKSHKKIKFGKLKNGRSIDLNEIRIILRHYSKNSTNPNEYKRRNVLERITRGDTS